MAQRVEIGELVDKTGLVQGTSSMVGARLVANGLSVQVNIRGGGAATVYQAATGGATHTNPLTSDAAGRVEGWVDEGSYDLVVSGAGITTYTQRFEAVAGASMVSVESGHAFVISDGTDQTADVLAAVASLPAEGGTLVVVGEVQFDQTSAEVDFEDTRSCMIKGVGGLSAGATPRSRLLFIGTGTGRAINARSSYGFRIEDCSVGYNNTGFTGKLIDLSHSAAVSDSAFAALAHGLISGPSGGTANVDLDKAILCSFEDIYFLRTIVRGRASSGSYSNGHVFRGCTFTGAGSAPVVNPGQGWTFEGGGAEPLSSGKAGFVTYDSGVSHNALNIEGVWMGDVATLPVTGAAATDLFTATAHGLVAGDSVAFTGLTGGTGLSATTVYYVIADGLTANAFKVSTTPGGASINFTSDLTAGTLWRGAWIRAAGDGLNVQGCYAATGAVAVDVGGSSFGSTVKGNDFVLLHTAMLIGAGCRRLDLHPNGFDTVTNELVVADGVGTIVDRPVAAVKLELAAHQSINHNTETAIIWDVETYDNGGMHAAGNPTRLVAPVAGLYSGVAIVVWDTGTTGYRQIRVRSNGSIIEAALRADATIEPRQALPFQVSLAAGGYVEVLVTHQQGVALQVIGAASQSSAAMAYLGRIA